MIFDYEDFTLEEIDEYKYHEFICDGDNKTITTNKIEEEE